MKAHREREWNIDQIISATAEAAGVDRSDILGKCRKQPLVAFRQAGMALAYVNGYGSPTVGVRFGYRDHTTVLHAVGAYREGRLSDPVSAVMAELTGQEALL